MIIKIIKVVERITSSDDFKFYGINMQYDQLMGS